jgi:acyl-CoA thioesterase-1
MLSATLSLHGCSPGTSDAPVSTVERSTPAASAGSAASTSSSPHRGYPRIAILGDSLTAGLGLAPEDSYVARLQRRLDGMGLKYDVVNAGVSGDTSAGGLRRVDLALEGQVRVLIVALGGNDGLRGLPAGQLRDNLGQIIERGQKKGAAVILAGMEAPTNYGPEYTRDFHNVYPELAKTYDIPLIPFLLDRVAAVRAMNQRDGIHPNVAGAKVVEQTVWATLGPVLTRIAP